MRYGARAIRELDVGDAVIRRTIDDDSPFKMLRQFYDNCNQVKDALNKQYRQAFFRTVRGDRSESRRESSRDDRRDDRDGRSSRHREDRDSRDRDRRDDDKGRDRYDDRKSRDRDYDDKRRDDKYSSRD